MKRVFNVVLALSFVIAVSGLLSPAAAATVTVYTDEASFAATLGSYYYEDFSNFPETGEEGPESIDMGPENGFSYTMKGDDSSLYYSDGAISVWEDYDALTIEFTGDAVTAFGGNFWPTTAELTNRVFDITIDISFADGSSYSYTIEDADVNTFIGFSSLEAISSFTISETVYYLYPTADNLYVGSTSSVPVPGAIWLMGGGLLALAGIRRRNA